MKYILPHPLQPGDTVGFVAPSSPLQLGRLEAGIRYFEELGYAVKTGQHLQAGERFLAGNDNQRATDIMTFIEDPSVKAIIATAGGYGSQRLLPFLDVDSIRRHPKLITGFSDTTALQLGLLKMTGLISYTGFTLRDIDKPVIDTLVHQSFLAALTGQPFSLTAGIPVQTGQVFAPLIGGNLECMMALMGTPYQPDFRDCILLIEDVFAEPFQTDSRLSQLQLAGVFDTVAGVIFGQFEQCIARHHPERDGTIADVIQEWSQRLSVPMVRDFPYGHVDRRCLLPLGKTVQLTVTSTQATVSF